MADSSVAMFSHAHNFTIAGGEFVLVSGNYTKNIINMAPNAASALDQFPPSPPLRRPSDLFTGHDTYIQALKDCFSPKPDTKRKCFLLYGMGGIGKTQICLKFIEQYGKKWFSDIFWIDASSKDSIDLGLKQIAQKYMVGSTPAAESALEWISTRSNWLMVFDNADGGYTIVEKFIPHGNEKGNILITSKDKIFARLTQRQSIEVVQMGKEEAIHLLLKSAHIVVDSEDVAITAGKLVEALGCIPLAIDQAGAYVFSSGCELDYYLKLFSKCRAKLMSDKEFAGASGYNYSTYGTWEISIEEIEIRAKGENNEKRIEAQSALMLHRIFAFLHHDNISIEIFENAAMNYIKRKDEITNALLQSISLLDHKNLFLDDSGSWNALQFLAGIKVLSSFSLIKCNGMLYSIHPLVQTWSRDRIPVVNLSDCCRKSRAVLACSLKLDSQECNYKFWRMLAPHIKANDGHAAECISDNEYYDDENARFALVFIRIGDWDHSKKLWSEALKARELKLGESHPDTLDTTSNLALIYYNQGNWKDAGCLQVKVMEKNKEILGPLHPVTLTAMGNLAVTYTTQGKLKEGEDLQMKVMEGTKEMLGPLHLATLRAMGNLAYTYSEQGKWKEAESLEVKVKEAREEILGIFHPETLIANGNLANTYYKQGRWDEAESLQVIVMERSKERLGTHHPNTLIAMRNLATTNENQDKWEKAESLEVEVMEVSKEILGPFHLDTLWAMGNLARTCFSQGKWKEAESLEVKVKEAREQILGPLHPDTLIAMGNLAYTYCNQGRWQEAADLQVTVLETNKNILEPLHPNILTAMINLANTYYNQGKLEEAGSLEKKVMEAREEIFGPSHPSTLRAMGNLAFTYSVQGKYKEAESLQMKVMGTSKEKLGPIHTDTLRAMANLAFTYRKQGKWKDAEILQEEVTKERKHILGLYHPDTLTAMGDLALTYKGQNRVKDVKGLADACIKGMKQVLGVEHPKTIKYMQDLIGSASRSIQHAEGNVPGNIIKGAQQQPVHQFKSRIPRLKALAKRG